MDVQPNIVGKQTASAPSLISNLSIQLIVIISNIKIITFSAAVGKLIAFINAMITVIIHIKVSSEKRTELSQTIASLSRGIRMEKGCMRSEFFQSVEDENEFCLLEEWATQSDLKSHMKSERFKVLKGAMNLLKEPCKMVFNTAYKMEGREEMCL